MIRVYEDGRIELTYKFQGVDFTETFDVIEVIEQPLSHEVTEERRVMLRKRRGE